MAVFCYVNLNYGFLMNTDCYFLSWTISNSIISCNIEYISDCIPSVLYRSLETSGTYGNPQWSHS